MEKLVIILCMFLLTFLLYALSKKKQDNFNKQTMTTKQMMYIVTFGALATVVGFFEVPIGFIGVKLDLSEVIILISSFVIGFKNTSFVIVLRSLVRIILPAKTAAEADFIWKILGEVIAILASLIILFSNHVVSIMLKRKQKPLFYAVPTTFVKEKISMYIVLPVASAVFLTAGLTIFHTIFTMPLYLSGYSHLTIFSFLADPKYATNDLASIVKTIVTMFGIVNLIKGFFSSLIYLFIKPQIERIIV